MTEITKSTEAKKDEMQVEKEKLESVKRADAAVKTMHDFTSPEVLYKELINSVLKYHPSTDISMIEKAYKVASEAHEGQKRKSGEPYIIHPLCVAIILADLELDKETIVAGLLHDVVEDCDGISIDDIRREFGDIVASYVYQESEDKSKTWVERKGHTIDFLKNRASRNAKIIALGDKLANIRALYRDYNILGEELWERFNMKDKKMQSWYYRGMIEGFADLSEFHEYEEYCQLVNEVFPEE